MYRSRCGPNEQKDAHMPDPEPFPDFYICEIPPFTTLSSNPYLQHPKTAVVIIIGAGITADSLLILAEVRN